MVFDPYAPPPDQPVPPYPPYPGPPPYEGYPPQYGWQPYPYAQPQPRNRSRGLLVGGGIALGGLVLLAFTVLLVNGNRITSVFIEDSVTLEGGGGHVEIPADERGPAFELVVPYEWQFVPTVPDGRYRAHLRSGDARLAIGSSYAPREDSAQTEVENALRDAGEAGLDRAEALTVGDVSGHQAFFVKLRDGDPGSDVWFAVFHGNGARWHARYTGPKRESRSVPVELTHILGGWQW